MKFEKKCQCFNEVVQHIKELGFEIWAPKRMFDKNDMLGLILTK